MAISIDWASKIIFVPKDFTTLVQAVPNEVRTLDINDFRNALKDLEDSEEGAIWPDTHRHNTEVTISGITLARVIEIINGYTITFEDGQYAVNLSGANSNIADVVNVNQVSVRSANSAGLTSAPAIEYSSFNGGVTVDVTSTTVGTTYPSGTALRPVNNLSDALIIATSRGLKKLFFIGNFTFVNGVYLVGYDLIGQGMQTSTFTFQNGAIVANCKAYKAKLTGQVLGITGFEDCHLYNYSSSGLVPSSNTVIATRCLVEGTLALPYNFTGTVMALDCWGVPTNTGAVPILDMGNGQFDIQLRNYSGLICVKNSTHLNNDIRIFLISGGIELDSTVTKGFFRLGGVGQLTDNTTPNVDLSIRTEGLMSMGTVSQAVWDEPIADHLTAGSTGKALSTSSSGGVDIQALVDGILEAPINDYNTVGSVGKTLQTIPLLKEDSDTLVNIQVGNWKIENKQMIFYDTLGVELLRYNLYDKQHIPSDTAVFSREKI